MEKKKPGLVRAIMDIPMALKGFPKNLTKKPKNAQELELCMRELNAYLFLAVIPLIIAVVLMALQADEGVSMIVGLIGFAALIFVGYRKNDLKNNLGTRLLALTCTKCNAMISCDKNVRYTVKHRQWSVFASKTPTKRGEEAAASPHDVSAKGEVKADVEIICKCQKCGAEKNINHTFTISECRKEQRNVAPKVADLLVAQFKNEVSVVTKAVFDGVESSQNTFGVAVHRYNLDKSVVDFFEI